MSRGAALIELGGGRRRLGSPCRCPKQLSSDCGAVMAGETVAAAVMERREEWSGGSVMLQVERVLLGLAEKKKG
ncbi:hypothetical protein M0R45_034424 [Rubus argutus]|uniref:Uncharacterized protein n=1 Tax=Rubus argutus TaxID=59490 RepID=A0AAW1VQ09_RUBAR